MATVDREKWKTEVEEHCRRKYEDEGRSLPDAMAEIDVLRDLQEKSGEPPPEILLEDMVYAKSKLSKDKTSGGSNPRVNEWIKSLPAAVMYWLLVAFNARPKGKTLETIETMRSWLITISGIPGQVEGAKDNEGFQRHWFVGLLQQILCGLPVCGQEDKRLENWWLKVVSMRTRANAARLM